MNTPSKLILPALSLLTLTSCSEEAAAGILAGGAIVYVLGSILVFGLIIYALYDLYTRTGHVANRLLWTIIILIVPVIGAIAYFMVGRTTGETV